MKFNVKHDSVTQKFFTSVGGKECSLRYDKITDTIWNFRMMFVPQNLRSQGIASRVVEQALNFAKKNEIKVKVSCSFVRDFLKENESYQDVLLKKEEVTAE